MQLINVLICKKKMLKLLCTFSEVEISAVSPCFSVPNALLTLICSLRFLLTLKPAVFQGIIY